LREVNRRKAAIWLTRIGLGLFALSFGSCLGVVAGVGERAGFWLTLLSGGALLGLVLLVIGLAILAFGRR